ncbi:hypothetical protein [Rhodoferax sp. GW822-FHT02A01]|uniref:hypothetical protein n=1 Tax=Rhodoferax sp. GW822-FHT02A01 TaxID=3141537 RepID=UPI00315C5FAB
MALKKPIKKNSLSKSNLDTRNMVLLTANPVWRAFAKKPVSQKTQTSIGLAGRMALYALTNGDGQYEHFRELVVTAHTGIVLAEQGYGYEMLSEFNLALDSILACRVRALNGEGYSLREQEGHSVNTLLQLHEEQVQLAEEAELASAIVEGFQRAQESN